MQKPEDMVNSTKAPPCSLAECSNERPSSITTTLAPAPHKAEHNSCSATDLPEPDLPNTATLWLPELFSNGDQKKGWPRRPISIMCGTLAPRYSPWIGARLDAVVVRTERKRFMFFRSNDRPLAIVIGIAASRPWICR